MANKYFSYPESLGNDTKQGQHYILFSSYKSTSAISNDGMLKSSTALYIPPNSLSTTITQKYNEDEGGATKALLAGKSDLGFLAAAATGAVQAASKLTQPKMIQDFMSAGFGLAKNNHVALVYKGPGAFRTHNFQFEFFPKSKKESDTVQEIIKDFKNGSTPASVGGIGASNKLGNPYFASPRQWEIKIQMGGRTAVNGGTKNPYLFEFKRSVITSFGVNHDPESVVSFHTDGSPVHSRLSLTFQEIEYVLSETDGTDVGDLEQYETTSSPH
jgi:hypothetical protein